MGKVKIDIGKAIELRVNGATLREIGKYFSTSPEAVRQAFQRADRKKKEQKRLSRLLVAASIGEQGSVKNYVDIAKTIDNWTVILKAAKNGNALESEVASLKKRLGRVEMLLNNLKKT